jgi:DNA mismatch endonuclease, patch repair protein
MAAVAASYPHPKDAHVSARMRRNRKVDSKPELLLRSALHAQGLRFRKNFLIRFEDRRVRPDIVFTRQKVAIFVDGCFWHRCPEHGTNPQFNSSYWQTKLDRNVERDRQIDAALTAAGWTCLRVWEHEAPDAVVKRVLRLVGRSSYAAVSDEMGGAPETVAKRQ